MASLGLQAELDYNHALQALKQGGIVAYPTETFYGLAVDPQNDRAVASLYALKKREPTKPLSLLVPDLDCLATCVRCIPAPYEKLIDSFWPGPLTLIFTAKDALFSQLAGSDNTLAIRVSSHPVAHKLSSLWGGPLTATSANISGQPALVNGDQVRALWGRHISSLLDGGPVPGGKGSTIVRCSDNHLCHVVRDGVIPLEELSRVLNDDIILDESLI